MSSLETDHEKSDKMDEDLRVLPMDEQIDLGNRMRLVLESHNVLFTGAGLHERLEFDPDSDNMHLFGEPGEEQDTAPVTATGIEEVDTFAPDAPPPPYIYRTSYQKVIDQNKLWNAPLDRDKKASRPYVVSAKSHGCAVAMKVWDGSEYRGEVSGSLTVNASVRSCLTLRLAMIFCLFYMDVDFSDPATRQENEKAKALCTWRWSPDDFDIGMSMVRQDSKGRDAFLDEMERHGIARPPGATPADLVYHMFVLRPRTNEQCYKLLHDPKVFSVMTQERRN